MAPLVWFKALAPACAADTVCSTGVATSGDPELAFAIAAEFCADVTGSAVGAAVEASCGTFLGCLFGAHTVFSAASVAVFGIALSAAMLPAHAQVPSCSAINSERRRGESWTATFFRSSDGQRHLA